MKYQVRPRPPEVVDAVQWDETEATLQTLKEMGMRWLGHDGHISRTGWCGNLRMIARLGSTRVKFGGWIVRRADGVFDVYDAESFANAFEPAP